MILTLGYKHYLGPTYLMGPALLWQFQSSPPVITHTATSPVAQKIKIYDELALEMTISITAN